MAERGADWMRQAKRDLASARSQSAAEFFEWACFASQQAAEKALKAVYQSLGGDAWGHATIELIKGLEERITVPAELVGCAQRLDRYYIPTRYPNGWANGIAADFLTEKDATNAIGDSDQIIRFCESLLARQEAAATEDPGSGGQAGQ